MHAHTGKMPRGNRLYLECELYQTYANSKSNVEDPNGNMVDTAFSILPCCPRDGQFDHAGQNESDLRRMSMFRQFGIFCKLHKYQLIVLPCEKHASSLQRVCRPLANS